jgi:hypothetical protein
VSAKRIRVPRSGTPPTTACRGPRAPLPRLQTNRTKSALARSSFR